MRSANIIIVTHQKESGNSENSFAVRLKRGEETVGHVPREISKICWLFIYRGSCTCKSDPFCSAQCSVLTASR